MPTASALSSSRIQAIDALRGFALAGIVLVHMVEQFVGGPLPESAAVAMAPDLIDQLVRGGIFIFFQGKFYLLFSFLFGVSFFLQMDRAAQQGQNFQGRFVWRLLILLLFGVAHSLVYRGDILTVYVVLGLFLPLFYTVSDRSLLVVALVLFLGAGRYLCFWLFGSDQPFGGPDLSPQSSYTEAYFAILKEGSLGQVLWENLTNGLRAKMNFQFGVFGRGYTTFAFFLIGLWVGRRRILVQADQHRKLIKRVLWSSVGLLVVSLAGTAGVFSQLPQPVAFDTWGSMIGLTSFDLANIALTGVIIMGFLLLFYRRERSALRVFAPYGRMALSNYLAQSVIGTFIYYGWGLGYLADVRNVYALVLGIIIIVGQMLLSAWWMQRFRYGPLEWIWRCATYGRWMPFVRRASSTEKTVV